MFLLVAAISAALAQDAPPVAEGFVLRPTFHTSKGEVQAGTAFSLKRGEQYVVVTAHNLFGPNGGLEAQVAAADLPGFVQKVELRDAFSGHLVGETGPALLVAGAAPMGKTAADDLALFPAEKPPMVREISREPVFRPAELASADPAVGDPIWLVVALVNATGETPKAIPARVAHIESGWLFYEFAATGLDFTATAGAPLVNAEGQVVGMHLGGGELKGKLVGSANPRSALELKIDAALKPAD